MATMLIVLSLLGLHGHVAVGFQVRPASSPPAWRYLRHTCEGYGNLCSHDIELYDEYGTLLTPTVVSGAASDNCNNCGVKVWNQDITDAWCSGRNDGERWVQAEFDPPVAFSQWRTYIHQSHVCDGTLILLGSDNGVDWTEVSRLQWEGTGYRWSPLGDFVLPPTSSPSPSPTTAPVITITQSASSPLATAKGDPHLQNIGGQRFDLMQPGWHVMVHIPRGAETPHTLFHLVADAERAGSRCGDVYFKHINISGAWVEAKHNGTLQFHAEDAGGDMESTWMTFGTVDLKVARGHNQLGVRYFNLYLKHLGSTRFKVGGLLGEDDHEYEATPDNGCIPSLNLHVATPGDHSALWSTPSASSAEASMA